MRDPCSLQNEAPSATEWIAEGCEQPIPDTVVLELSALSYQARDCLAILFSTATDADVVRLVCCNMLSLFVTAMSQDRHVPA